MTAAYRVFGLDVLSAIDLPELTAGPTPADPDVTIRVGRVEAGGEADGLHVIGEGDLLFAVEGVARYRISNGREIVVDPVPGAPERNVRLFLLGSAFGALLHQRGVLPLHANAIEIGGKAVAFMGESGAGKSTLAAWFHDRGYRVLADDVCVVGFDHDGQPHAFPGLPRLRLWLDALESSGRTTVGFNRSFAGLDVPLDKYDVPVDPLARVESERPLSAVYLLGDGADFSIERLTGMAAADAIMANTYRGAYVAAAKRQREHWQAAVELARLTPIHHFRRSRQFGRISDDCERLLGHVFATVSPEPAERESNRSR